MARSLKDFMAIRRIRNECRFNMTRDTAEIGPLQQVKFWFRCALKGEPRVYIGTCCGRPVAYGVIALGLPEHSPLTISRKNLVSGGLVESHRGFGLGKQLFTYLTLMSEGQAYLEVLKKNLPGYLTYRAVGYRTYAQTLKMIYMRVGVDEPKRSTASAPRKPRSSAKASRKTAS